MIDSKTVATLWAYLEEFDKTNNPSYLISAWSLFEGLIEKEKLPEFSTSAFKFESVRNPRTGGSYIESVPQRVTPSNVNKFARYWISQLLSWASVPSSSQKSFVLQLAKYSLIKLLTAIGAVTNPFELATNELIETVEEGGER